MIIAAFGTQSKVRGIEPHNLSLLCLDPSWGNRLRAVRRSFRTYRVSCLLKARWVARRQLIVDSEVAMAPNSQDCQADLGAARRKRRPHRRLASGGLRLCETPWIVRHDVASLSASSHAVATGLRERLGQPRCLEPLSTAPPPRVCGPHAAAAWQQHPELT
jgi:hypothetical protein